MRGWCGCGARPMAALDVAPAISAVEAAPACCWVRREHAIDAMAGGATALASEEERAAAQHGSPSAAGEKTPAAGEQPPANPCRQLQAAGLAHRGEEAAGSARQRRRQGRLPAPSADRR